MLDPRVYQEAYGLEYFPFRGNRDGLYRLRSLRGKPLLSTSPYLTDTPELTGASGAEYREFASALHRRFRPEFTLIKSRDRIFAENLGESFRVEATAVTSLVDLRGGEGAVLAGMDRKRRRQIEKGLELKPEFRVGRQDLVDDFYAVFVETQTRLGTPAHSKRWFEKILEYHPESRLMVSFVEGEAAACALLLNQRNTLFHPYTGTLPRYFASYLNCSLYWEMIRWGIAEGAETFDLGRSFIGSGVHAFKKYWGGRDLPLYYAYQTPGTLPDFSAWHLRIATKVWSFLPPRVAGKIGPALIRSVP